MAFSPGSIAGIANGLDREHQQPQSRPPRPKARGLPLAVRSRRHYLSDKAGKIDIRSTHLKYRGAIIYLSSDARRVAATSSECVAQHAATTFRPVCFEEFSAHQRSN